MLWYDLLAGKINIFSELCGFKGFPQHFLDKIWNYLWYDQLTEVEVLGIISIVTFLRYKHGFRMIPINGLLYFSFQVMDLFHGLHCRNSSQRPFTMVLWKVFSSWFLIFRRNLNLPIVVWLAFQWYWMPLLLIQVEDGKVTHIRWWTGFMLIE